MCQALTCRDGQDISPALGLSAQARGPWRIQTFAERSVNEPMRHLGDRKKRTVTFVPNIGGSPRGFGFPGRPLRVLQAATTADDSPDPA